MAAAAITPRSFETFFKPASFPVVSFMSSSGNESHILNEKLGLGI